MLRCLDHVLAASLTAEYNYSPPTPIEKGRSTSPGIDLLQLLHQHQIPRCGPRPKLLTSSSWPARLSSARPLSSLRSVSHVPPFTSSVLVRPRSPPDLVPLASLSTSSSKPIQVPPPRPSSTQPVVASPLAAASSTAIPPDRAPTPLPRLSTVSMLAAPTPRLFLSDILRCVCAAFIAFVFWMKGSNLCDKQGGQIMDNAVCGGPDSGAGITTSTPGINTSALNQVKAVIMMGNPRYRAGLSYNVGTCTAYGVCSSSPFFPTSLRSTTYTDPSPYSSIPALPATPAPRPPSSRTTATRPTRTAARATTQPPTKATAPSTASRPLLSSSPSSAAAAAAEVPLPTLATLLPLQPLAQGTARPSGASAVDRAGRAPPAASLGRLARLLTNGTPSASKLGKYVRQGISGDNEGLGSKLFNSG